MESYYPQAVRQLAPQNLWGNFTGGPFKGVLHTTEVLRLPTPGNYYGHTSYPHFTVGMTSGRPVVFQHVPVTRAARALRNVSGGVQTNGDSTIQIEIAWKAADGAYMPSVLLDAIGHLMRWIEANCGVQPFFVDNFHHYPPENGHRLGNEPWRMSNAAWERFNGWCGHQHVPENLHGDPGKIDVGYLLKVGRPVPTQPLPDKENEMTDITCEVPWMDTRTNGRDPFFQVLPGAEPNSFNVFSFNDAPLDRVDGVYLGIWFLTQKNTTGRPIGCRVNKRGQIVVFCEGGGTYKVADSTSAGRPA